MLSPTPHPALSRRERVLFQHLKCSKYHPRYLQTPESAGSRLAWPPPPTGVRHDAVVPYGPFHSSLFTLHSSETAYNPPKYVPFPTVALSIHGPRRGAGGSGPRRVLQGAGSGGCAGAGVDPELARCAAAKEPVAGAGAVRVCGRGACAAGRGGEGVLRWAGAAPRGR